MYICTYVCMCVCLGKFLKAAGLKTQDSFGTTRQHVRAFVSPKGLRALTRCVRAGGHYVSSTGHRATTYTHTHTHTHTRTDGCSPTE